MKKILSIILSVTLLISCVPIGTFAQDTSAADTVTVTVESAYSAVGDTVEVDVAIADNPGVAGATLSVAYHEDLTLVSAESGDAFSALDFSGHEVETFSNPSKFSWDSENAEARENGVILKLKFKVSEEAEYNSKLDVSVSYRPGDVYTEEGDLTLKIINGCVMVIDYKPGDLFEDGVINTKDVRLIRQLINGNCSVEVKEAAADVNADGVVNTKDTRLLRRYINGGYPDAVLLPSIPKCSHTMEAIAYKAATCEEDGNASYYHCTTCDKNYNDIDGSVEISLEITVLAATGHTVVIDEAVAPTPTSGGLTEGRHCSVCGKVIVAQEVIPPTAVETHEIIYDVANGDPYLEKLLKDGELVNPNPSYYEEGAGLTLSNLSVAGYRFLGWYDLAENGTIIKKIDADATENYQLYAYWSKIEYTVQYKSSLFVDRAQDTYTVDTGLVLPTPKLSNYSFVGWSDENGKLLTGTTIPVGTTGNMILDGNWTSERNKTWTKPVLDKPIIEIDEEEGVILFAYEIGKIENVPLYTIYDFGYISGDGVTKTEEVTYKVSITDTMMKAYAKSVAKATTESSNWTLANTWNESTSINEEWCQENGKNVEQTDTIAKNESQNWNISNSNSGSTETTSLSTDQSGWKNDVKVNASSSKTDSNSSSTKTTDNEAWNVDAKLSYTPKSYSFGIDVFEVGGVNAGTSGGWGGEIGGGYEHKWGEETTNTEEHSSTSSTGLELGGSFDKSTLKTDGTTSTTSWNDTSSYGGSISNSSTTSNSTAISEKISQKYGYGSSYIRGGEDSTSQGLSASQTDSESYSSSVTYSTETSKEITKTYTTTGTKPGYHRWVKAGTAHVFAVVGYDMTQKAYFVYTYSVMDDETHDFEDYSYTSNAYNDQENGVISFEIPYEVSEYVGELTTYSDGLKVNQKTGIIEEYTGEDTCVVIPEYWNVGNGDVVKVTGFAKTAFQGNENICTVVLSDFITEIPDYAFQNCTSLKEVVGGNVNRIGSYAFDGCTDAEDLGVRSSVEYVGEKAFDGVQRIIVNAANKDVLEAAVGSGAEQIIVSLEYLEDGEQALQGMELTVPMGTKFFEINGNEKTYEDFSLVSAAEITVLNKIHFVGKSGIPVDIDSPEVVFNQSSVTASGIGLVLRSDVSHVGLQNEVTIDSANENAMLAKGLSLYEVNKNVVGKLVVKDKLLQCGTTEGSNYLSYKEYEAIDLTMFDNLLNSYTLYFDANGGFCDEGSRSIANSMKLGVLPIPTREHYNFEGWFLENGTAVTEESSYSTGTDITVYAKWTPVPYTVAWNTGTGYSIAVNRTNSPNADASISTLSNGDVVYYGDVLTVTYTASTGYTISTKGCNSITVSGDVTSADIYATAEVNNYTISWNNGTNCEITVERTSSPYANEMLRVLASGDNVYYGDVLRVTYTANTGYSIDNKGSTSITVTDNVTPAEIYAVATPNKYTYNIVYRSSNGTSLGTATAGYLYGTTNTITPPNISGYITPGSQMVSWDSVDAKTIVFTYTPTPVDATTKSGYVSSSTNYKLGYSAQIEYQNRTATSVQIRVTWTASLSGVKAYNNYAQWFRASAGSASTGNVRVISQGTWGSASSSTRSGTASSGWITVPLNTTNATAINLSIYYYQANYYGTDMTPTYADNMSATWSVAIPAY